MKHQFIQRGPAPHVPSSDRVHPGRTLWSSSASYALLVSILLPSLNRVPASRPIASSAPTTSARSGGRPDVRQRRGPHRRLPAHLLRTSINDADREQHRRGYAQPDQQLVRGHRRDQQRHGVVLPDPQDPGHHAGRVHLPQHAEQLATSAPGRRSASRTCPTGPTLVNLIPSLLRSKSRSRAPKV